MKWHTFACLVWAVSVVCGSVPSGASQELPTLVCLKIQASLSGPAHPEITLASLRRTIFVELKAKLPRLLLAEDCEDELVAVVSVKDMSSHNLDAWHGVILLNVYRSVTVNHTGQVLNASVWTQGVLLFEGNSKTVSHQVTRNLTEFIEKLAEEYYLSGN